jgi:rubrerythrin
MASTCPKCHQVIEDDIVCCLDVKYTWKCKSCGKLTTGFVVPYGRCFLCGGEHEVIKGYHGAQPEQVEIVREAVRYELEMYHFYRLALEHTADAQLHDVLEELAQKEEDHLSELEGKYHLHFDREVRFPAAETERLMSKWIFEGIDFGDVEGHIIPVYDKAIAMERRTRDHFKARAEALPQGAQKDIYTELAAEEEEHVSILETEREQLLNS